MRERRKVLSRVRKLFKGGTLRERNARLGILLVLPSLIWIFVFVLYPVSYNIWLSFQSMSLLGSHEPVHFVGLDNYLKLATEPEVAIAFTNDIIWTLGSVSLQFIIGLGLAILLNERLKLRFFFRGMAIVPYLIPTVAAALIWTWMLNDTFGIVNMFLRKIGLIDSPVIWLASKVLSMPVVIVIGSWKGLPFMVLILLAGLQGISPNLYDAAKVDGAAKWQRFRHITLPGLRKVIPIAIILKIIWTFNWFDIIWLLTAGGPGKSTLILPTLVYIKAFKTFQISQSAALVVMMSLILIAFIAIYSKLYWKEKD